MYNQRATQIKHNFPEIFSFLLLMGGCARKVFFGMSDLGCHNRPFLVGSKQ
jgi:hypothetical protein